MKIDRRSFLSFVIGGAAGTALSPLPWKLTDDSSIWSQNWPWTPVPPGGEVSYENSTCTLCRGGCGITVRKVEGRAVKIEGRAGHPVNDGGLCILGLSGLQMLYGPTRIKQPLKRVGKRGEGRWAPISWSDAIAEVAGRLGDLRAQGQAHALAAVLGTDRGTVAHLFDRFMTVFGSPNFIRVPSVQDAYELALFLTQGVQAVAGFDFENADFVLSFGSGLIEGWGSPVRMFRANSQWRAAGGRVVQVEARLSNTAAKADRWIAVTPGSEAALALGLAHVIIREKRYQAKFVNDHSVGFEQWKARVLEAYAPEQVAAATGLDPDTIVKLAREFVRASRPLAVCGRGQGNTSGSLMEFVAVHALNALVGNINRPGGVWAVPEPEYIAWPEVEMDQKAAEGMQQPRCDGAGDSKHPYTRYLLHRLTAAAEGRGAYPLQALLVSGANPCYAMPDSKAVKAAFEKIPFIVSFSSYMDETALQADLLLPNHTYLESYEDVAPAAGLPYPALGLVQPVVAPQFDTRHVGDTLLQIAAALQGNIAGAFPWEDYEACLRATLGDKWDTLVEDGFWIDDAFKPTDWSQGFETATGKFVFSGGDMDAIEVWKPVGIEGPAQQYPLILVPYDSMRLASGAIADPPFMIKSLDDTVLKNDDLLVEVNPQTARTYGLKDGKPALLSTPRGSAQVRVHYFEGIGPGLVAMPRGLGHTAYDGYLAGKGVNYNELIGPLEDPASGLDAAWGIRAKLAKV